VTLEPDELEELRRSLDEVAERLDDLIVRELSEAVERGEQRRPESERRLSRVRAAVGRAIGLLEAP
jgi:hypothetical protein